MKKPTHYHLDQFVQEMVLGKIASDIYNQAKEVAPLRHVGIRKSKLLAAPQQQCQPQDSTSQQQKLKLRSYSISQPYSFFIVLFS